MSHYPPFSSRVVPLLKNDIDTDQIIPARFLKGTDKSGLGEQLFADWRYHPDGSPRREFVLNKPENRDAQILLVGDNFGCGSSREHAPWALTAHGFKAVISTSFADIFSSNSLKNGLLPIVVETEVHNRFVDQINRGFQLTIAVDLEAQTIVLPDGSNISFPIDGFSKACLLNGVDELGYLLSVEQQITAFEQSQDRLNSLQEDPGK